MQQSNNVQLQSPYTIPEGGCYIGYSFTAEGGTDGAKIYWCIPSSKQPGSNFRRAGSQSWADYSGDGYSSSLCATITGDFYDNAAKPHSTFEKKTVGKNETASAIVKVTNLGTSTINNITYIVTDVATGQQLVERTCVVASLELGKEAGVSIDLGSTSATGMFKRAIKITKVNGQVNPIQDQCIGTLCVLSQMYSRKVVVEEGTGTWCGYCPRGIVAMEAMAEKYPDNFIGIAVHSGDEMQVDGSYYPVLNYFSGFPGCIVNRQDKYNTDPTNIRLNKLSLLKEM